MTSQIELDYHSLIEQKQKINVKIIEIIEPLENNLKAYHRIGYNLYSLDITDIKDGIVHYNYITTFRNEFDDTQYRTIPLEIAQESPFAIEAYYEKLKKEIQDRNDQEERERIWQMNIQQAENEKQTYERLKAKYEQK